MKPSWPFIGNEIIGQRLLALVDDGRFPTASAILGPQSIGKRTAAVWMAQRSICQQPKRPCGQCVDCKLATAGAHPRLTIVTSENPNSIGIDAVRLALERFTYVFDQTAWLIIPDAERLTEAAQNALLKFLEEPPAYTFIVLTAPHEDVLSPTVTSRLVKFRWSRCDDKKLRTAFPSANREDLVEADGRPGLMTSLLADPARLQHRATAKNILQASFDQQPLPKIDLDQIEEVTRVELGYLRQLLHESLGLRAAGESILRQPPVQHQVIARLQRFLPLPSGIEQNISSTTMYAYHHLV